MNEFILNDGSTVTVASELIINKYERLGLRMTIVGFDTKGDSVCGNKIDIPFTKEFCEWMNKAGYNVDEGIKC